MRRTPGARLLPAVRERAEPDALVPERLLALAWAPLLALAWAKRLARVQP
jgi:hypothetical protein